MPRPTSSAFSKSVDGRPNPGSPRWGGVHGSGSNQGQSSDNTSRRGVTPVSSPRSYPPPPGSGSSRGSSARDQHGLRGTITDISGRNSSGSAGSRGRKSIESDCGGGAREDGGEDSGRIRVAVRVRPFSEKEKLAGKHCVISMAANQTKILDPAFFDSEDGSSSPGDRSMWERTFNFDHSFWSHSSGGRGLGGGRFSSQADVHQALGIFLLDNACRGFNCSLFAYGQTGSGKTYTMLGDSSDLTSAAGEGTAGLIPRICVELFERFGLSNSREADGRGAVENASRKSGQASIQVSFCEIYNEQVRDLFAEGASGHGLRVREHPTKGAFVEGLSARPVVCYQQVQQLLEDGMSARATAATAMNEVSSRSHAIFTIHITVTFTTKFSHGGRDGKGGAEEGDAEDDVSSRTSKICLVDLAGSERANATGAKGDRLREAANINKSLSTLGDVIKALAKKANSGRGSGGGGASSNNSSNSESFIPYRNSMLTWLLKDSIGGNSKTVMLAAISPVAEAYQETMSTLRYVERAKDIVNSIAINDANANPLVGKLREEVRALQELLEVKEAGIAEHEAKEAMLTAALERAREGDDDKVLRALADADDLQASLQAERREKESLEAAAAKQARSQERKHARELQQQADRHAADSEERQKQHEEEMSRAREEAEQVLACEVGLAKDQAVKERESLRTEWEEAAEVERLAVSKYHQEEMAAVVEQHRTKMERSIQESVDAAARAAESAATELSELRAKHAIDVAESSAAAEARQAQEIQRLREEFDLEKESMITATSEARLAEEAARDTEMQERIATAVAAADETREAAIQELRDQHDRSFEELRKVHAVAVKAAIDEATERLRAEHEDEKAAAQSAAETTLKESRLEEARLTEKKHAADTEAAISALSQRHEAEVDALRLANETALKKAQHDADAKLAARVREAAEDASATQAESARTLQALTDSHNEKLASARREYDSGLQRAVEEERSKAKVEQADATEALRAEAEEARAVAEQKHREEICAVEQRLEAEIKALVDDSELREREAVEKLAAENENSAAEAKAKHGEALAAAEVRWRDAAETAAMAAEKQRTADIEAAELRASEAFAKLQSQVAATLAAEQEKHRDEMRRIEKQHKVDVEAVRAAAEDKRASDLTAAENLLSRSLSDAQNEREGAIAALDAKHREALALSEAKHKDEVTRLVADAEDRLSRSSVQTETEHGAAMEALDAQHREAVAIRDATHREEMSSLAADAERKRETAARKAEEKLVSALSAMKTETEAVTAAQDARHRDEMLKAQEGFKAETLRAATGAESRREADLVVLRQEIAQGEDKIKVVSELVEQRIAALREKMAELKEAHKEELIRLGDEHSAAVGKAEKRHAAELSSAESTYKSSADAIRVEMAEEKAEFVSKHLLEMRKVKEAGVAELQRASREAEERNAAQQVKAASELDEAKAAHLRDLQAAAASAEEARKAELEAAQDTLASTTSELKSEIARLEEQHRDELQRKISEARETESDVHAKGLAEAIAEANAAHEKKLEDSLQAERSSHAAALSAIGEEREAEREAAVTETNTLRETLQSEHRLAVDALEEAHRVAIERSEESSKKVVEELKVKVEVAQTAAADAQASANELETRAEALDEMLKASVGSNEEELAGHRSRVAQLQGFVARREAAVASASADGNGDGTNLSPAASRSLQQRVSDLRALAVGAGVAGLNVGGGETGLAAFASTGLVEGLTMEKYAEELEVVLVRATVEAATARQDHLEADLQCQGVTRQLVGLKLVHAQLRECLEDTQVKLEHKSQSAARRLLNSAARLAYEFAKPDRFSSSPPRSPKSTKPRAMNRQNSASRSPRSRARGIGAVRRNKAPQQEGEAVSNEQVAIDFSATL
ncbi:unnamed protein product [Ectocarpus fasciculatus]